MYLTPEQQKAIDKLSAQTDAPNAGKRFETFARLVVSVPKEEADQEQAEVESGKPLERDFAKTEKPAKK